MNQENREKYPCKVNILRTTHNFNKNSGDFKVSDSDMFKIVSHPDLTMKFRKSDGLTVTEGKNEDLFSPVGAFIADIEIVTICHGVPQPDGSKKLCEFCSPAGSKINTPNGYVSIENLSVGDLVKSYDEDSKSITENEIKELYQRDINGQLVVIEVESGEIIKLTPNHLVFTNLGWVSAGELNLDMEILNFHELHD